MSEAAFSLLAPGVQRTIWEMGWKELRPIQVDATVALLTGTSHLLICAATASGKTEAAFLPIISRLADGEQDSIRAVYVGPLKALINDQFTRLDRLCERIEIPVHRWHGDVTASQKQALRREPGGILLITPESLESNFINYGSQVPRLYRGLEFVVVDELHSFLGNVRGVHLLSLLSRLRSATGRQARLIGLSATLSDPEAGKRFLAPDSVSSVVVIQERKASREIRFVLKALVRCPKTRNDDEHPKPWSAAEVLETLCNRSAEQLLDAGGAFPTAPKRTGDAASTDELAKIAEDIVRHFATSTNLVFVNSRRTAEELAVRAHDQVASLNWPHDPFMIHHGSVAKDVRQETESALKSGVPTTAICSSTLEMGIDIGSVRAVGQVDPPWSVASLLQRLGRSGRREGEPSIMRLYVREDSPHSRSHTEDLLFPELLRGVALTRLMLQNWLEPPDEERMHLSTLVHQVFSHLKQTGGMRAHLLYRAMAVDGPFRKITQRDFGSLLRALASRSLLEQIPTGEIILAPNGEQITSAHDFYAAFKGAEMFSVRHRKTHIGELPLDALPPAGQVVILAGRRWLVQQVEPATRTVWVSPAKGGKVPVFLGNGGELHTRVVGEMRAVLFQTDEPSYLDAPAKRLLQAARHVARSLDLERTNVIVSSVGTQWFPWVGTRCLRTISILAQVNGFSCETRRLSIGLPLSDEDEVRKFLEQLASTTYDLGELGSRVTPRALEKFDEFLPEDLLNRACAAERLALGDALACIRGTLNAIKTDSE